MKPKTNRLLLIAGFGSLATSLLHVAIIFLGAPAYRYFGAGEPIAKMAESGSLIPAMITTVIIAVVFLFALYAFSGAGFLKPLPFLTLGLFGIGTLFTLRGLLAVHFIYQFIMSGQPEMIKEIMFSLTSLVIGLFYLGGTLQKLK